MKNLNKLVISAMFAAIACVATMIIKVPTVGTAGYVNIGDTIVLLCAWIIGGTYGALAAGIGSMLADILSGYSVYAPGTFAIKFLMAFIAYYIFMFFIKGHVKKIIGYVVSGIVAEAIMIVGYFVYEATFLGYGLAASASIVSNLIQGVTCLVIGTVAVVVLEGSKALYRLKKMA